MDGGTGRGVARDGKESRDAVGEVGDFDGLAVGFGGIGGGFGSVVVDLQRGMRVSMYGWGIRENLYGMCDREGEQQKDRGII